MHASSLLLTLLAGAVSVSAHGHVSSPPPRLPGPAMRAACGDQIFNVQNRDNGGPIQDLENRRGRGFDASKCNLWLCKGYQFDDNTQNLQRYRAGETIDFKVDIRAPHTGTANVSVVHTASNTLLSQPLIFFNDYASSSRPIPDSNKNFRVTMPNLGNQCTQPGECTLQFYWDSRSDRQSYESCVDFVNAGAAPQRPASVPAPPPSAKTSSSVRAVPTATRATSVPNVPTPAATTSSSRIPPAVRTTSVEAQAATVTAATQAPTLSATPAVQVVTTAASQSTATTTTLAVTIPTNRPAQNKCVVAGLNRRSYRSC
ncbi:hypothetical protein BC832DRAFT_248874 [Gaertneriomyces semiglobifer]|nr:hypothetical protein BC832DRAFT_248874 [Gaertneriomyces semiglobifer]